MSYTIKLVRLITNLETGNKVTVTDEQWNIVELLIRAFGNSPSILSQCCYFLWDHLKLKEEAARCIIEAVQLNRNYTAQLVREITCTETNTTLVFTDEQWNMAFNLIIKSFGLGTLHGIGCNPIRASCACFLSEQLEFPNISRAYFLIDAVVEIEL